MKKNIMKSIFVLAVFGIAFLNINKSNNKSSNDHSLFSLNQEALADCEIVGEISGNFYIVAYSECHWACESGGYFNCPI